MDAITARINYMDKIMKGLYTKEEADQELDRIAQEYGESAFLPGKAPKREKPWTMEDLQFLRNYAVGDPSRELLSYMAEVSEYVFRKQRIRRIIVLGGIAAAVIVAGIVVAVMTSR